MSTSMIDERSSGVWNRVIVAGVKPHQFLISHLIEGFVVVLIQLIFISIFVCVFLSDVKTTNSIILITLTLFLVGLFGIAFGIFASVVCKTVDASLYFNQFFNFPAVFISGMLWPMEAQPKFLQFIGYLSPFSYPGVAMRSIGFKNATIENFNVQMSFLVLIIWISIIFSLSIVFSKRNWQE